MEELYKGNYLTLKKEDNWEYVERIGCSSAVIIIPETIDDCVILVQQNRKPFAFRVIEFPAGLVGDENTDEEVMDAAYRELREETGYVPIDKKVDYFGSYCTSPGLTNEKVHLVRIKVKFDKTAVPEEGIRVYKISLKYLKEWLDNHSITNEISDKVLFYALKYEMKKGEWSFKRLIHKIITNFLNNMIWWTFTICISLLIGSCTIKGIVDMWR